MNELKSYALQSMFDVAKTTRRFERHLLGIFWLASRIYDAYAVVIVEQCVIVGHVVCATSSLFYLFLRIKVSLVCEVTCRKPSLCLEYSDDTILTCRSNLHE